MSRAPFIAGVVNARCLLCSVWTIGQWSRSHFGVS